MAPRIPVFSHTVLFRRTGTGSGDAGVLPRVRADVGGVPPPGALLPPPLPGGPLPGGAPIGAAKPAGAPTV